MEMRDMTLEVFCTTTASNEPTPGSGSVSALAGALTAALTEMVAQLTIDKKGYEEAADEVKAIIPEAAALHAELLDEITRGSTFFNAYMEAMTLSKDTGGQKEVRRSAMQGALKKAAEVSLHIAVTAAKIISMTSTMVKKRNANAVTGGVVAAMIARTAIPGALLNAKINLGSIKDEAYIADTKTKIHGIGTAIVRDEAAVLAASPLKQEAYDLKNARQSR